ncbi:Crp/Fnr family transcriptional regulator [Actinospongicola halichondriae]|uniref:Crp/Fnr family transcriptional regulator n=1 Tax=Actinospongicola halichondriae TaxID=3236844 RepID=UPI003D41DBAC
MADVDLSKLEFFEDFTPDELKKVRALAEDVSADAGAVLMEQGDVGQEAFVICAGQAGVYVGGNRVATIGPGSAVGEMALLDKRPRSATVRALTDLELLSFKTKPFQDLLETMPKAAGRVIAQLNEKLREQNQQL